MNSFLGSQVSDHLLISKYCINFPNGNIKPQKPYPTLAKSIQANISHAFPAPYQVIKKKSKSKAIPITGLGGL
jgi:hypothetical protein